MEKFENKTVGEIVSENIVYAQVFQTYGIDFCCEGDLLLTDAVSKANVSMSNVLKDLEFEAVEQPLSQAINFNTWSLDLLIDYINKFHHYYIRSKGPEIYALLEKVVHSHGQTDSHLHKVIHLFGASLIDLHNHLDKEEQILFPLIREILKAEEKQESLPFFHCGSVQNPIRVMVEEHDGEGDRFKKISSLTDSYRTPAHACVSYKQVLEELRQFEENLHIHIHVENNILFRKAIELENRF